MKIISRKEALSSGLRWFFTGEPCKAGHICPRLAVNYVCKECALASARKSNRKSYQKHRKERLAKAKLYAFENKEIVRRNRKVLYWRNPEKNRAKAKSYYYSLGPAQRERRREIKRAWYKNTREQRNKYAREYYEKNRKKFLVKRRSKQSWRQLHPDLAKKNERARRFKINEAINLLRDAGYPI